MSARLAKCNTAPTSKYSDNGVSSDVAPDWFETTNRTLIYAKFPMLLIKPLRLATLYSDISGGGSIVNRLSMIIFIAGSLWASIVRAENLLAGADIGYGEYLSNDCVYYNALQITGMNESWAYFFSE